MITPLPTNPPGRQPSSSDDTPEPWPPADRCDAVDELLTYEEFARLVKAPQSFVEGLVRRGDVPHVRLGGRYVRVRTVDVQAYLRGRLVTSQGVDR